MKKGYFLTGAIQLLIGVLCGICALYLDTKISSLLLGFCGVGVGGGIMLLWKYFYWTRPQNKSRYEERSEKEKIELNDERKEGFRDKSGRYAYILGLVITVVSIVVFLVLGALEMVANTKIIVGYLSGYLVFQYIVGILIFNYLNKKY